MGDIGKLMFFLIFGLIFKIDSLPMKEKEKELETHNEATQGDDWELNLEYGRYLKEVVQALESDPEFRKKLEMANVEDIKSGKIARELPYVEHHVRTKLDELKRRELERLRHLAMQENEKKNGIDRTRLKIPVHVDHRNPTKFESEDLRKLITQLNVDLENIDKERQTDFKKYEMEKEFEYKEELKKLDETQKKDAMMKHDADIKKHKDHPKLHHPGSKQQFEEVWEEQDHMKSEDFEPNTFFHLHDLDGNNYWDEFEVKALFQNELDKMYDPNAPEDDQRERQEEMERMREHVFRETDTNGDNLISIDEFMVQTRKNEFERDDGWEGLDEQEMYSRQEYEKYEHEREAEIRHLIETGQIPAPPGYQVAPPQPIAHPNSLPNGMSNVPMAGGNYIDHPNMIPQGYADHSQAYQQMPQGYQQIPQSYQQVPLGHQQVPQGYQQVPHGYQQVAQGYDQVPLQKQNAQGQIVEGYHPELAAKQVPAVSASAQIVKDQSQKPITNKATAEQKLQYQQQQIQQQKFEQPLEQHQFQQPPQQQFQQQQQYQQPPQKQFQQIPQQQQPNNPRQPQGPSSVGKQNTLAQENLGKQIDPSVNNHIVK